MQYVAFISYARADDRESDGSITEFHRRLESALRLQFGSDVTVFLDKNMKWGENWSKMISNSLSTGAFLIPIMTPRFFNSDDCRNEVAQFKSYERNIGRTDLVLPIYFIKSRQIEKSDLYRNDALVSYLTARQHRDWRDLRFEDGTSMLARRHYSDLAQAIFDRHEELRGWDRSDSKDRAERDSSGAIGRVDAMLDHPVNFGSLVAYTTLKFPQFRVSVEWTNQILVDIDHEKYKVIRDIDAAVNFAKAEVDKYARARPEVFGYGTDFITKSLILVDLDFRSRHPISPDTLKFAQESNLSAVYKYY